jgi:protocatechuate 3,4-dioxygenase beta subunit
VGNQRQEAVRQLSRRAAFAAIGAAAAAVAAAAAAAACGDSPTSPSSTSTGGTTTSTNATCAVTPTETIGPYPSRTDMFRSDIRENRGGTPLTLTVKVVNVNSSCAAVVGADVEIWHVDAAGDYSQYGSQTAATFLRGIQTTNATGEVTFTTIYPGWYQGRATHIHAEVTMGGRSIKVTQIAFPESVNNAVHATGVYASRGSNPMSNQSDGIFADSLASELVTPTGSPSGGYSATFQIGVSL